MSFDLKKKQFLPFSPQSFSLLIFAFLCSYLLTSPVNESSPRCVSQQHLPAKCVSLLCFTASPVNKQPCNIKSIKCVQEYPLHTTTAILIERLPRCAEWPSINLLITWAKVPKSQTSEAPHGQHVDKVLTSESGPHELLEVSMFRAFAPNSCFMWSSHTFLPQEVALWRCLFC